MLGRMREQERVFYEIKDMMHKIESSKAEVKSQGHSKRLKYERKVRRYRQFRRYDIYLIRFAQRENNNKIRGKDIERTDKNTF